jgi:hypothetical protein
VQPGPETWTDPKSGVTGKLYRFVTWVNDTKCGPDPATLCPGSQDYKRITIALTVDGNGGPKKPILVSSIASDPAASPTGAVVDGHQNPLTDPSTKCLDGSGALVECSGSIGPGIAKTWFLYDTPASFTTRQDITGNHATHATVAPTGTCTALTTTGCPTPDLMGVGPPPSPDPLPALFKYSSEQSGTYPGGRVLRRDSTCSGTPTSIDNSKGELWATDPVTAATTFTGDGALTLFTQTLGGATAQAQLCLAFYDVPNSILNMIASPPTEIGRASYSPTTWPSSPTAISFPFDFRGANGPIVVPAGDRLGVRAWPASTSGADIAVIYDHPSYISSLQLNTAGS